MPLHILKSNTKKAVFLNFSTSAVYSPASIDHDEEDHYEPIDIYGWTKKHTEELAKFYSKKFVKWKRYSEGNSISTLVLKSFPLNITI